MDFWNIVYFADDDGTAKVSYCCDSSRMYASVMDEIADKGWEFADVLLGDRYVCSIDRDGRAHFDGSYLPVAY